VKLVVTGAGGGLGRAFLARVPAHHDIAALGHADLDIGDHDAVMQTVPPLRPDAILNFAAFTKVDANETDPKGAVSANAVGPQNLALAARRCGAALLHVSTDYVFDGEKGSPYDELDNTTPLSVYGRTKLAGEMHVRHLAPEHIIVRIGHVFGGGTDFLSGAVAALRRGDPVAAIDDRRGTPTFVGDIAQRLLPILMTGRSGTYHLASPYPCSWFEVLTHVKALEGLTAEVRVQPSADLGLVARRPMDASLTSVYVESLGIEPMPSLDDSLSAFLAALDVGG
jgi:dTDP-4-dehydrorhamnose reductase